MNFDYNEEQQLLADSVRRFLQKDYDFEARRKILASPEGWSERVWATFADMGLTGLPLSPDYGGFGGGAVDLMSVMEAFGEALVVEPYLPTILGALAVAKSGDAAAKAIDPAVGRARQDAARAGDGARARGYWRADGGQDRGHAEAQSIARGSQRAANQFLPHAR